VSILDKIKGFLTSPPDSPTEPELTFNEIPESYFEDAYLLHLDYDEEVRFIDVEHQRTRNTLAAILSGPLGSMGHDLSQGLSGQRDRRLTRLVTATLHDICSGLPLDHVAGLRYKAPDKHWDAFVLWDSPARIDLSQAQSVKPLFPDNAAVQNAAKTLGLKSPKA